MEAKHEHRAQRDSANKLLMNKELVPRNNNRRVLSNQTSKNLDYTTRLAQARNKSIQNAKAINEKKSTGFTIQSDPSFDSPLESVTYVESTTKLRISNQKLSKKQLDELTSDIRVLTLPRIPKEIRGEDVPGDWMTVAILYEKSAKKTSQKGSHYMMMRFTDLKGYKINVFVFDKVLESIQDEKIGAVIALLNPKILRPSEVDIAFLEINFLE